MPGVIIARYILHGSLQNGNDGMGLLPGQMGGQAVGVVISGRVRIKGQSQNRDDADEKGQSQNPGQPLQM